MRISDGDICIDNFNVIWTVHKSDNDKHPDFVYLSTQILDEEWLNGWGSTCVCLVCKNGTFINHTSGRHLPIKNRFIVSILDFDLGI